MTSKVLYKNNLRTECTHLQSGNIIQTDAPTDNKGRGEYFSPTDLVATALASCMITIMGIAAETHHINIEGLNADVLKVMESDPRRIGKIVIQLNFPSVIYTDKEKKILENAALNCPVAKSLNENLVQVVSFNFQE